MIGAGIYNFYNSVIISYLLKYSDVSLFGIFGSAYSSRSSWSSSKGNEVSSIVEFLFPKRLSVLVNELTDARLEEDKRLLVLLGGSIG